MATWGIIFVWRAANVLSSEINRALKLLLFTATTFLFLCPEILLTSNFIASVSSIYILPNVYILSFDSRETLWNQRYFRNKSFNYFMFWYVSPIILLVFLCEYTTSCNYRMLYFVCVFCTNMFLYGIHKNISTLTVGGEVVCRIRIQSERK